MGGLWRRGGGAGLWAGDDINRGDSKEGKIWRKGRRREGGGGEVYCVPFGLFSGSHWGISHY